MSTDNTEIQNMALLSHLMSEKVEILDKIRLISNISKKLCRNAFDLFSGKALIWLNDGLYSMGLLLAFSIVFTPISLEAGVVSFVKDIFDGDRVEAEVVFINAQNMPLLQASMSPEPSLPRGGGGIAIVDGSALLPESGVVGTWADIEETKSTEISLYIVRQGDSLSQIAKMFGVSVNTIVWANDIKGPIKPGDELVILPISGVNHIVAKGDTLRSIATKYKADLNEIMAYNNLKATDALALGTKIIIPDGEISAPKSSVTPSSSLRGASGPSYEGYYVWPVAGGRKTQGLHGYNGIDIGAPRGTAVYASADGTVIVARSGGWNGGYGSYIVITHPNGTQTLYAHMQSIIVSQGNSVKKGEAIGSVGSTGKSTGPHLHFEVRGAKNPF